MMRRLVEAWGADYVQWRALTRAGWQVQIRRRGPLITSRKRRMSPITAQIVMYGGIGIFFGIALQIVKDPFVVALLAVNYVMFMIGTTVLLEHHTAVTAVDDYGVLGFHPINSRTYLAARISNFLKYVLIITAAFGAGPAVILGYKLRDHVFAAYALLLAMFASSVTVALAMLVVYGWLSHRISAHRLTRVLSYVQTFMSLLVYGSYFLLPRVIDTTRAGTFHLEKTVGVLLYPPTWFCSYVELARGMTGANEIFPVVLSLIAMAVVVKLASGKFSEEFTTSLADVPTSTAHAPPKRVSRQVTRSWSPFPKGEGRAIWLLIRGQFRSDHRFRMAVMGAMPITVVYFIVAVFSGGIRDPFNQRIGDFNDASMSLFYLAIIMFPVTLYTSLSYSEQFKASWIFYATPSDRTSMVRAMKNAVFVSFVLPYLGLIAVAFLYYFTSIWHVLAHLTLLALLSSNALLLMTILEPQLPFSRPMAGGERGSRFLLVTFSTMLFSAIAIPLTARFIYISALRTVIALAALYLFGIAAGAAGRNRIQKQMLDTEFVG